MLPPQAHRASPYLLSPQEAGKRGKTEKGILESLTSYAADLSKGHTDPSLYNMAAERTRR
jgi:hypothetical protein